MAYNEGLADRVRGVLGEHPRLREQKMFGGLAFMVAGPRPRTSAPGSLWMPGGDEPRRGIQVHAIAGVV